jgi:hypothetical protein
MSFHVVPMQQARHIIRSLRLLSLLCVCYVYVHYVICQLKYDQSHECIGCCRWDTSMFKCFLITYRDGDKPFRPAPDDQRLNNTLLVNGVLVDCMVAAEKVFCVRINKTNIQFAAHKHTHALTHRQTRTHINAHTHTHTHR